MNRRARPTGYREGRAAQETLKSCPRSIFNIRNKDDFYINMPAGLFFQIEKTNACDACQLLQY